MENLRRYLGSKGIREIIIAIAEKYWDPNGIWKVTTEADEEGWGSQTLGIFNGYINEIAFALTDKSYYSLTFTKLDSKSGDVDLAKVNSNLPVPVKPRKTVNVKLDNESGIMNLKPEDRTFFLKLLLRDEGVVVSEGQSGGSVCLTEQLVSIKTDSRNQMSCCGFV